MYFLKPTDPHPITPTKAAMLALLCLIWLGTGLVGHDPWKPDEAYSFGVIYSMLQSGDWLVPTLAGEPYMANPPLFYWTAAGMASLFSPLLSLHDGARLASGLYSALTLLFLGLTSRKLYGENRGWAAAVILIGCLGLLVRAHQLITDLALLTSCAMMLYGFTYSQERPLRAAFWLGTGTGIGFMAKGFIAPLWLLLIGLLLPALFASWRRRAHAYSLLLALLVALPWLTIWPLLLYQRSPELFASWAWSHNIGNWLAYIRKGPQDDLLYYLKNLTWLAWPALPLATWAVWRERRRITQRDDLQLPLLTFVVMFVTLSLTPNIREVFALPMLLPLALLAAASLSMLKRGAANALDWFGLMTFALLAILMWWGWAGLLLDNHAKITIWLKEMQPGFEPELQRFRFGVALAATVLWLLLVWRVGRSMRRAVVNWAAGTTLIWILAMTLWLPWLDSGKSYRSMALSLKTAMPAEYNCVARNIGLGDAQRAMLHYFANVITKRDPDRVCTLRLIQGDKLSRPLMDPLRYELIWEGSRKGDMNEHYRLYREIGKP
ncbi:MAG: glycosyltransferase family 39 protein [Gallionella sp.]|nr:glycosyltransferase family 39 protein [Gallionella sp.]MDD4947264.1 glycosyltransferase family 39 protein [Gallionella sp.]MDD5612755.1 glycosyltransferase family 39 protein [Gallionella sp.]